MHGILCMVFEFTAMSNYENFLSIYVIRIVTSTLYHIIDMVLNEFCFNLFNHFVNL